jgi:hypothetical protein
MNEVNLAAEAPMRLEFSTDTLWCTIILGALTILFIVWSKRNPPQ